MCFPMRQIGAQKGELRLRPVVFSGGIGSKFALVRFRRSYLEVDLEDARSGNRLLWMVFCDGALRLR